MSTLKLGQPDQESALPQEAGKLRRDPLQIERVREELSQQPSSPPHDMVSPLSEPQRLMNLYLSGKLSMGELAFELRKYNSVVADTLIRDGKNSTVSQMDYREVPRASMANPGQDLNPDAAKHSPPPSGTGKHGADTADSDADEEQKRKQAEKAREQEKKEEKHDTIVRISLFEQEAKEMKSSHNWREQHRKDREQEEERFLDATAAPEEKIQSTRLKGSAVGLRIRQSAQELQKQAEEKQHGGARRGGK